VFVFELPLSAFHVQQDLDAEFTAARLLISKMKGEVLSVIDKAKQAETNLTNQTQIIEQKEKEIHEYRNKFSQHEQAQRILQEEMRDAENKKRTLEEQLDQMTNELSTLKQQVLVPFALAASRLIAH
jgi:kinesin family protein 5